ncbi:LOW QUALITY PROTEIN: E3 ubiquitin-protein ligase SHPRH [Dioscorea cayenensis subsp. rotundata]|uniref:LOW QUALITY PROTEIN: E3 ubiquitin-protein ligase SHPRH n=1 Tax=Dioscorea cayennensis subsp. rotundata TaxID=55577 RepID=A0AB40BLC0_DIOCR|nr:LOW QUALITY PROTEIN: E3 ubiquitin-protein ligase SHPRH [Dioscorea cayenensis subsp. rotundata]
MGRRKARPIRSEGISSNIGVPDSTNSDEKLNNDCQLEAVNENANEQVLESQKSFYINIDRNHCDFDEYFDIAEIILNDVRFPDGDVVDRSFEDKVDPEFSLRFKLIGVEESSVKLGHWPVISADNIFLECIFLDNSTSEGGSKSKVLLSGVFDGPDEGVSGLVHLVSQKLLTIRLVSGVGKLVDLFRVRVEILRNAFNACESLLEIVRQPWRKSMINVMPWLRPEVTSSEAIYGITLSKEEQAEVNVETTDNGSNNNSGFDAAGFYDVIKPSKEEPMLEERLPDLLPQLRPYQLRAVYWMLQQEKRTCETSDEKIQSELFAPFSVAVTFLEKHSRMFYNPFNGNISLHPESSKSLISGGILADEMGLGKTVELLACIFANRMPSLKDGIISSSNDSQYSGGQIKRQKRDRVECICGAATDSSKYEGLWVQCDVCDAWQHANCVGYKPKKKHSVTDEVHNLKGDNKVLTRSSMKRKSKKNATDIIEMAGNYTCALCSELFEAANSNISTGATLIVCPAPILAQWYSEVMRHTRPGSLKVSIYDGAKNAASSATLTTDMCELAATDIVLTTYDVLREDLSHDSDRHDGDRRFMRFMKKYPVTPTVLTRINWWRLCLDEAQMVESNTSSVTEMAMRIRAQHRWCITGTPIQRKFDDMYGLLRFLRANPFDVYRWWAEVIRDPYERRDAVAVKFAHRIFKQIMWRSSKIHVADELQLPPQEEHVSWLNLSPIEEHFYQKQHQSIVSYALGIVRSFKNDICKRRHPSGNNASFDDVVLSRDEVARLLFPLLKLRQACCHPQVGSSGLCSLQSSPLTMDEILEVLVGKAKIEGEEALRRIVVALNGLAAIAIIEGGTKQAVSLYRESLALVDEHANDFRLDPLLSLHIYHNLAELLPVVSESTQQCSHHVSVNPSEDGDEKKRKLLSSGKFDQYYVKRRKMGQGKKQSTTSIDKSSTDCSEHANCDENPPAWLNDGNLGTENDVQCQMSSRCFSDKCLKKACEDIKQKYLSVFTSKLSMARRDYTNSHSQVCNLLEEYKNQNMAWYLNTLNLFEKSKDSSEELLQKIDRAVSNFNRKTSSRSRNIGFLKYTVQAGLDSLEQSRQALLKKLMEIDQAIENPKDDDIAQLRDCPACNEGNGSLCGPCELDDLFQVYEASLFLIKRAHNDSVITSVEEALDLQKQKLELRRFFRDKKTSIQSSSDHEKMKQRNVKANVQVYRLPSELEVTLGVIKSYSKSKLSRQDLASARKHLLLFQAMRREFSQARGLFVAQAQMLHAHDEIKCATSRLRLKLTDDEPPAIDVLSKEELIPSSMQFTSDKFSGLSSLTRIRGQLRYLKGLVQSNQKAEQQCCNAGPDPRDQNDLASTTAKHGEALAKIDEDETCPICHEGLNNQKMVFQCGHIICCKCCLKLTEEGAFCFGRSHQKWIMCPTCRQQTAAGNIAFVQDKQNIRIDLSKIQDMPESCITVQGSYSTKIEAITRRILFIKSTNQDAQIIVFSSWNDVLDVLEHSLDANGITHVRMKGGRKSNVALAKFKGQASNVGRSGKIEDQSIKTQPIQVLLMLFQHGANGLNLLEAEHVILVEPLLNPAFAAQAIGRVHRIGQTKKTFVHRFIVKNTVEENIHNLNKNREAIPDAVSAVSKHQDQPALTLKDVQSLFSADMSTGLLQDGGGGGDANVSAQLPPSVAAGLAAERRWMQSQSSMSNLGID